MNQQVTIPLVREHGIFSAATLADRFQKGKTVFLVA
jgi:hypothetical protein